MGSSSGRKATRSGDAARLLLPSNCSGVDAASGRGVRILRTLHNPHRHLDTEGNRARWTNSCTVPIEPHLQQILSADDRSPHMAFSRNGTLGQRHKNARGEAALKKAELAACAGRLVLRQRAVAYAAIGTTMPSYRVDKQCHARVPSVFAC